MGKGIPCTFGDEHIHRPHPEPFPLASVGYLVLRTSIVENMYFCRVVTKWSLYWFKAALIRFIVARHVTNFNNSLNLNNVL